MADEQNAGGSQADAGQQNQGQTPQANNSGTPQAPASQAPQAGGDNTSSSTGSALSQADYERIIADLRKENAAHRTGKSAAEAELKKLRDAQLSEEERRAQALDEAVKRAETYRTRIGSAELKVASQAAGIIDPDVAVALLGSKVDYDETGEPKNVAKLVEQLKADKPHLFAAAPGNGTAGTTASGQRTSSGGATNPGSGARAGSPQQYQYDPKNPPRLGDPGLWKRGGGQG